MKKFFSIMLVLCIALCFCSCSTKTDTAATKSIYEFGKEITTASAFCEGLGFVLLDNDQTKAYCITEDGDVVFEIYVNDNSTIRGLIWEVRFINGLALFGEDFYDKNGKKTSPEDVGVKAFSAAALDGGYILATTDDEKTGIMDTNFNWTVEPTTDIYEALGWNVYERYPSESIFLYEDHIISDPGCINLVNGGVVDGYQSEYNWEYAELEEKAKIFIKGKSIVTNYDDNTFTVIDENEEQLFEPIKINHDTYEIRTDGNIVVMSNLKLNGYPYPHANTLKLSIYDMSGTLVSELNTDYFKDNEEVIEWKLGDGAITINTCVGTPRDGIFKSYIYDTQFNRVF